MKITSFQPMILESAASSTDVKELFESIGFKVNHNKNANDQAFTAYDLKNEDGFKLTTVKSEGFPQTMMAIRMNVDNFAEGVEFLEKNGFVNKSSGNSHGNTTSVSAMMVNADGLIIIVDEHLK